MKMAQRTVFTPSPETLVIAFGIPPSPLRNTKCWYNDLLPTHATHEL